MFEAVQNCRQRELECSETVNFRDCLSHVKQTPHHHQIPITMSSRPVRNQADLPPEIMDHIFAQLGRNSESSHQNTNPKLCTETSCSSRDTTERSPSIRVYVRPYRLDLLLNILCTSNSLHVFNGSPYLILYKIAKFSVLFPATKYQGRYKTIRELS